MKKKIRYFLPYRENKFMIGFKKFKTLKKLIIFIENTKYLECKSQLKVLNDYSIHSEIIINTLNKNPSDKFIDKIKLIRLIKRKQNK